MAARRKNPEPPLRIAPLGELRAYTISEHELENLEQGTPVSDLLTIGLCLLSSALTLFCTLVGTPLPTHTFTLFFCSFLIVGLGGGICTFLGYRLRKSTKELTRQIRARMPETPPIQQTSPEPPPPESLIPPTIQ